MADPKRVDPGAGIGGIGGVADLLKLFGGQQSTTKSTADTSAIQNVLGQLQGQPDYGQLLQSIFSQAAGQMPGLQARFSNAIGARSGGNSAVQNVLSSLLQDTALKGQQQVVQQQQANQQLQAQLASTLAQATRGERTQQGTNLGRAATGLGALQAGSKLLSSDVGKKAKDAFSGLLGLGGGGGGPVNLSSAGGDLGSFSNLGSGDIFSAELGGGGDFGNFFSGAVGDLGAGISDVGSSIADWFGGDGAATAGDTAEAGSGLLDTFDSISDFFSFADGGLVGRDGEKGDEDDKQRKAAIARLNSQRQKQTSGGIGADERYSGKSRQPDPSSSGMQKGTIPRVELALEEAETGKKRLPRYADGGEVISRAGGGRRSSAPGYTPDAIQRATAQQTPGGLNPQTLQSLLRQLSPEAGGGFNESSMGNPGFSFGVGPLGDVAAAQNQSIADTFGKAVLGMMAPVGVPGLTNSPLSAIAAMVSAGLGQQNTMNEINEAQDPLGALAAAQGWLGPTAASGIGSGNLAAAANAIANATQVSPMDALMQITNAFGTGPGGTGGTGGVGIGSDSGGLGGTGSAGSVSTSDLADATTGETVGFGTGGFGAGEGFGGFGGDSSGDSSGGSSGGDTTGGEGEANGGLMRGPGSGTSDSIMTRLSNGEYVIPADVVRQLGVSFFDNIRNHFHSPVGKTGNRE